MPYRKPRLLAILSFLRFTGFTGFFLVFSQVSFAGWTLNDEASSFYYVTSKAAAVSELNSFAGLSGTIGDDGNAIVSISLGSVDTAVDIRNERMRDIVFQIATYPLASASLAANGSQLSSLGAGESLMASYDATVELKGMKQTIAVEVAVTGLQNGGLLVSLTRPLIVSAASFGLADEVEQLREIAGLPSINNNVVVDFTLQFDAD